MDLLGAYGSDSDADADDTRDPQDAARNGSAREHDGHDHARGSDVAKATGRPQHDPDRETHGLGQKEMGGAGKREEGVKAGRRVVQFQVPISRLKQTEMGEEEDYRPRKRLQVDHKGSSLFDSLPAPKTGEDNPFEQAAKPKRNPGNLHAAASQAGEDVEKVSSVPSSFQVEAAPSVPTNPNDMYRVDGNTCAYAPDPVLQQQQQQHALSQEERVHGRGGSGGQDLLAYALSEDRDRERKRGMHRKSSHCNPPKVMEVSQSSLRATASASASASASANPVRDALGDDYENQLRKQAGNLPSTMSRRKHQIGSLYYDSKMREIELLENRAKSMKTKSETHAKYGW